MKKYLILIPVLLLAPVSVNAADGKPRGQALAEYLEAQEANAQKKGWKFNKAKSTETFGVIDANGDGVATGPEKKAYFAAQQEKKKGAAQKAKGPKGLNQKQFIAQQKEQAAKKGWKFKEESSIKNFQKMDTNSDGIVTGAERKAFFANR